MDCRKLIKPVLWIMAGMFITVVLLVTAVVVDVRYFEHTRPLLNVKYQYGDLIITPVLIPRGAVEPYNASQILNILKDGIRILSIIQKADGKTIAILQEKEKTQIRYLWQDNPEQGISEKTCYTRNAGEMYWDLDVDGQFDLKFYLNEKGKREKGWIYKDKMWQKVKLMNVKEKKAMSDSDWFQFEEGKGWRKIAENEPNGTAAQAM